MSNKPNFTLPEEFRQRLLALALGDSDDPTLPDPLLKSASDNYHDEQEAPDAGFSVPRLIPQPQSVAQHEEADHALTEREGKEIIEIIERLERLREREALEVEQAPGLKPRPNRKQPSKDDIKEIKKYAKALGLKLPKVDPNDAEENKANAVVLGILNANIAGTHATTVQGVQAIINFIDWNPQDGTAVIDGQNKTTSYFAGTLLDEAAQERVISMVASNTVKYLERNGVDVDLDHQLRPELTVKLQPAAKPELEDELKSTAPTPKPSPVP